MVDPIRDVQMYLDFLAENKATLKYVLETHFHADFVSGHIELAEKTGATIVYGPTAKADYAIYVAQHKERIKLGATEIEVLHTPGHTPESVCYLVHNEAGEPESIFTGDTLFVGDVGRPDLLEGLIASTGDQIKNLYNTIQNVIKKLPENLVVYPSHGPGSMCGKSIGKETESTIAKELASNYALQEMDEAEFQKAVLSDQLPAPWYFQRNAMKNREGYGLLEGTLKKSVKPLNASQVSALIERDVLILDTRKANEFAQGHLPGSINIGLDGSFAIWVGSLIHNLNREMVLIVDESRASEAVTRLARVGYENIQGYLQGGVDAWGSAGFTIETTVELSPESFANRLDTLSGTILDVRGPGERNAGHLPGSEGVSLRDFPEKATKFEKDRTYFIHCAGGYRSMIAASWLQRLGFQNVINIQGGYGEIKKYIGQTA